MQVIGAGFGRTGTLSMKYALQQLGFDPCYHMEDVFFSPQHLRRWRDIGRGERRDWLDLLEPYQATVDWPVCNFFEEALQAHPSAKVVLTVRDDPARWYDSVLTTIYAWREPFPRLVTRLLPPLAMFSELVDRLVWQGTFDGRFEDREHAMGVYEAHNARVKEVVPAGQLLVFNVKEGWEPLCRFLDVPIPDTPFPHANDRQSMHRRFTMMRWTVTGGLTAIAALIIWLVYQLLS